MSMRANGCVGLLMVFVGVTACASSASVGTAYVPDGGVDASAPLKPSTARDDAGSLKTSDAAAHTCGTQWNGEGCPCAPGSSPRQCYVGATSQAGVHLCTWGHQTCMSDGESGGSWGACSGQGSPTTCAAGGAQCGSLDDGCGGVLDCGQCEQGETCSANMCGTVACNPTSCADVGYVCGQASDGCGGTLECGSCTSPETCNGAGACSCTPTTCDALGYTCGSVSDGCGGTLDCGSCTAPATCGGGGTTGICGGGTYACTSYNIVGGDLASCSATVAACGLSGTCSLSGGCCSDDSPPGTAGCVSVNPGLYGACIAATICHACPG